MFTDPIIEHARRKFTDETQLSWEDFLRAAYVREARLQDALIVDLATGDPITEDEAREIDPYRLAVMYETGELSKDWGAQKTIDQGFRDQVAPGLLAKFLAKDAERYAMMLASSFESEKPHSPCGGHRRWRKGTGESICFDCTLRPMLARGFVVPSEDISE